MKTRLLTILLLAAVQPLSAQQQWVEQKKDFTLLFSQEIRSYNKVFDYDGNRRSSPGLQHAVSRLDAEFALSNRFSVFTAIPFLVHNKLEEDSSIGITSSETVNEPGDAEIGLRYRYQVNPNLNVSAFFSQSLGTATNDAVLGLNTGYADYSQNTGGGIRWRKKDRIFASLDLGYRLRHKDFGDEINTLAEIGFKLKGKFWFLGRSEGVQPLENGDDEKQGGNFGLYQQYQGYWNTGGGVLLVTDRWDFSALISANFKGQLSPSAEIYRIGIRYKIIQETGS